MSAWLWIIATLTVMLLLTTLLPLTRKTHWFFRVWDFPRLQQTAAGLALLALTAWQQPFSPTVTWLLLAVQLLCTAYQLWWIFPYTLLCRKEVVTYSPNQRGASDHLRVMTVNVLESNRRSKTLLQTIQTERPDILIAVETDNWWMKELDDLGDLYPHVLRCPLDNLYGMLVYSVWPLEQENIEYLIEPEVPSMHFDVVMPSGRKIQMHCLHPAPPSPTENDKSVNRDAELVLVARRIKDQDGPTIVAGDLNDVAWSSTTRLFRKISGLVDPRVGRGMFNSFHAKIPFLRWPLDHLFHSQHFALKEIKRLPAFGSDHFPFLADLALLDNEAEVDNGMQPSAEDKEYADAVLKEVKAP